MNKKMVALALAGIAVTAVATAFATGALNVLTGNNRVSEGNGGGSTTTTTTTTTTPQSPLLSAEYTGSRQLKVPCNSYSSCGDVPFCYPGIPCENNFIITNKGGQSVILSGYRFPDRQSGGLWQPLTAGENYTLSLWDQAGYESSSITLTTSSGYEVTIGTMPPQSITVSEGHGFRDSHHVSLALIVESNSSIPSPVNFTSYSIQDPTGKIYANSSLGYTTMPFPPFVNGYGPVPGRVTLSYGLGFVPGSNYTVTLTTSAYGSFPFQVTGEMFQALIISNSHGYTVMDGMNATGALLSAHFTVVISSIELYQVLVYNGNTIIGTYTCPGFPSSPCTFSGSAWITVTLSTMVNTVDNYWVAFSFTGDAPGYLVTF